jgi:hypothetical protein
MDLVRKLDLQLNGIKEYLIRETTAPNVLRTAMDDFLEHQMSFRMMGEVGIGRDPLKIASMAVDVSRNHKRADRRQTNEITYPMLGGEVGLRASLQ